jgi:hypothetical protein
MRRVYLSFLGIGSKRSDDTYAYDPVRYTLNGKESEETEFVQTAEIGILGAEQFDEVIIVATERSMKLHFGKIEKELNGLGVRQVSCILIEEDMSSRGQWQWFEKILDHIHFGDRLTVDLTHGYRAIPIVFSAAIGFLQKARKIVLDAVYYGAYEKNRHQSPIIDMRDFYLIGEWAEGVSRLVEDADARKLTELAKDCPDFQAGDLNDPELIRLLDDLTHRIRNVDMHNVGKVAEQTLLVLRRREEAGSTLGNALLNLLHQKYLPLVGSVPLTGRYDKEYFQSQLALIDLLLEHKLYMQAFTVMREVVGSIGLIENPKALTTNAEGKRQRRKAEVFINMLQFDEPTWRFNETNALIKEGLKAFYDKLAACGIERKLRAFLKDLLRYRNGFDHGWTAREAEAAVPDKAMEYQVALRDAIQELSCQKIII